MTNAAAAPGAPPSETHDLFTLIRVFRNSIPLLTVSVPLANLSANARAVFHALYWQWSLNRVAFCSLEWLVIQTGRSERSVRRALRELEAAAAVLTLHVVRREGGYWNQYVPGPETGRAVRELASRGAARAATLAQPDGCGVQPATGQAGRPRPAKLADIDFSEKLRSESLTRTVEPEPPPPSSAAPAPNGDPVARGRESAPPPPSVPEVVSLPDARLARLCLTHLAFLANPQAPPREPSGRALAMAAARLAELGDLGDAEKLRRAMAAVESAHRRSLRKSGKAPSPGYVFGTQSYFVGHLERAERERARAFAPAGPASEPPPAREPTNELVAPNPPRALPEPAPRVPFKRDTPPASPAPSPAEDAPNDGEPPEHFAERREASAHEARAEVERRVEAERQRARARLEAFALATALAEHANAPPAGGKPGGGGGGLGELTAEERAALERADALARLRLRARQDE